MTITNTFMIADPMERSARQAVICRRCILLLVARAQR